MHDMEDFEHRLDLPVGTLRIRRWARWYLTAEMGTAEGLVQDQITRAWGKSGTISWRVHFEGADLSSAPKYKLNLARHREDRQETATTVKRRRVVYLGNPYCLSPSAQCKKDRMKQFLPVGLSKIARYVNPPRKRYPHRDYPALESKHVDSARLFAHRNDLISSLRPGEGGVIAEIGVAHGDFSEYLLDELRPKEFVAFDLFNMEDWSPKRQWSVERLNNMTHLEFYRRRFYHRGTQVKTEVGLSHLRLAAYADKYFDFIYIDADHSYDAVKKDLEVANVKLNDNGVIILNDYIMFSHTFWVAWGVVQAVNEFIVNNNWKVCALALDREMYCDIAIRRPSVN
jgi:hypothetical protein